MHTTQHIVNMCLMGILAENRTIILVTHHVSLCLPIASYIVELGGGKVLHHGAKTELAEQDILEDIIQAEDQPGTDDDCPTLRMPDIGSADLSSGTATPFYSSDSEADPVDGKLIEAEARAEGRVSLRTYLTYIYAAGIVCWILTIMIMLFIRFINIGNQVSIFI